VTASKRSLYFDLAERMFVREQRTLVEIAARVRVHKNTLGKWRIEGAWDRKREQYQGSQIGYIERLERLRAQALEEFEKDRSAAAMDKLAKLDAMVLRANKPIDIRSATIEVMDRYASFLKRCHPELVEATSLVLREFFAEVERAA